MTLHRLKIDPKHFRAVIDGTKTFELRWQGDRPFEIGDSLLWEEWDTARLPADDRDRYESARKEGEAWETEWWRRLDSLGYTGRSCRTVVTSVLRERRWLPPGLVGLGIRREEGARDDE